MYTNNLQELNASLAKVYETMQDRRWSVTYTDRRGERRTVSAKDEQDAKRVAQEFKGKGMKGIAVNASDAQQERYFNQDHRAAKAIVKEATGRNLEGAALSAALTATCMSHWYDLISTFTTRTDVYDVHPIQKKNGFKILRMTPGHDVKDQAYESVVRTSTSLTASLNKLFGKDVFEPRVQRADGNLETLVAFKDSAGGVFQCKAKVTGGDTEIYLTIPEESELDTAFNSMLGLARGAENELAGPDDMSPVAGDPAPKFDPSAEDDIEPNTDIANLKEPQIDLEDDDGDFRNLPAHPDQRIESKQQLANMTLIKNIGSIRYYTDQYSNGKYTGVKLDGRESFILHPTDNRWVESQSVNKQISKYLFTDEDAATNAVKLAIRKDLNESKQPPQVAKAYKNGYISGQESSHGDPEKATIPDNYRGTEHEGRWKQGFRDGFKNKPVKESRHSPLDLPYELEGAAEQVLQARESGEYYGEMGIDVAVDLAFSMYVQDDEDVALFRQHEAKLRELFARHGLKNKPVKESRGNKHWTTTPEENFKKTPVVGSHWRVDEDGAIGIHVVTSVADGVVYSQNTKTLEKFDTPLKLWAGSAAPHKLKEEADWQKNRPEYYMVYNDGNPIDSTEYKTKEEAQKAAREYHDRRQWGHTTVRVFNKGQGVKEPRVNKTDGVKHWQKNRPEYYMVYNDGNPIDSTEYKTKEEAQKAARAYHDRRQWGHTTVRVFNKGQGIKESSGRYYDAAKNNVMRYLGDLEIDPSDPEHMREEIYTLAHDGAVDAGARFEEASEVADRIADEMTSWAMKESVEEPNHYIISKRKNGEYGVAQDTGHSPWDHSLHHGTHKTVDDAKAWAKKHAGKYPHKITIKESIDSGVYIVIDWDGGPRKVKVVQQSHGEIHLEDINSGESTIVVRGEEDFNEIKRKIEDAEAALAWREKMANKRQGRHYHESTGATNSVGAAKDAGHATAHAPDAVKDKRQLYRRKKKK